MTEQMHRAPALQRILKIVFGATALAFALAVAIPHHHGKSSVSHHAQNCRACRFQENFSATSTPTTAVQLPQQWVETCPLARYEAPNSARIVRLASPRAPPVSS